MNSIPNSVFVGDCREILRQLDANSIAACITDPPYNYEFIGHRWDDEEIGRRLERIKGSSTLVKNIPYGSGLAGGVRNARWYKRIRENIMEYQTWCHSWGEELYRVCKPGAYVAVFNSTRTMAHVQVALEKAGFYARDCIVYRRQSGIPKGLNAAAVLRKRGDQNASMWDGWHSCLRGEWEAIVLTQKPLENNYIKTASKYGVGLMNTRTGSGGFQSNIIEGIQRDPVDTVDGHCTVKPLPLMEKLVGMLVPKSSDNIVLDPFAGTGTTLVAAQKLGLPFIGIEINEKYATLCRERLGMVRSRLRSSDRQNTSQCARSEIP